MFARKLRVEYEAEGRRLPCEDIILFGRSLGTALATDLALRFPCRCLILESPFTNSQDMARLYAPFLFDWRPSVPYDNLGKIGYVKVPVMVVHGAEDEIIPVDMGRRVYGAAPEPKVLYIIPGAHHNDTYLLGGTEYFRRLKDFIHRSQTPK